MKEDSTQPRVRYRKYNFSYNILKFSYLLNNQMLEINS